MSAETRLSLDEAHLVLRQERWYIRHRLFKAGQPEVDTCWWLLAFQEIPQRLHGVVAESYGEGRYTLHCSSDLLGNFRTPLVLIHRGQTQPTWTCHQPLYPPRARCPVHWSAGQWWKQTSKWGMVPLGRQLPEAEDVDLVLHPLAPQL